MPINSTHIEYDQNLHTWLRSRDVLAGEQTIRNAGTKYLPKLELQSQEEYAAYAARASFYNATARTADAFLGTIFRRPPFLKIPANDLRAGPILVLENDADLNGATLEAYARFIVSEVLAVGRAGTLIDWENTSEQRVYFTPCLAESILNWRTERIHGRPQLSLLSLAETVQLPNPADPYVHQDIEQIRLLQLVPRPNHPGEFQCEVELWRRIPTPNRPESEWALFDRLVPLRKGQPLPAIPFVFHGPRHSRPSIDKPPLEDLIAVNLDHYRLNADYKHGMHFTALPTAWVSGFPADMELKIGSSTVWVSERTDARAGFLEFTGQGLTTFERAMDRDERLLATLGSRLLEPQKRVAETAQAISIRQSGELSVLGTMAISLSQSLTQALRWAWWWNSNEKHPDNISTEMLSFEINGDFDSSHMSSQDLLALVQAWQAGAITHGTLNEQLRRGEIVGVNRLEQIQATATTAKTNTAIIPVP
ncbi:MAG: hypothetical protein JWN25_1292 [Verrucomicrobiales bacterium]|nr:hypothetical protein [Verrucomicrobiales bacterium]MDB6130128.1 hypothetical protein [Verrucomicrobiales bacterium]